MATRSQRSQRSSVIADGRVSFQGPSRQAHSYTMISRVLVGGHGV
ncbi:hypothetical protein GGE65_008271 [Skermanella aerolata]